MYRWKPDNGCSCTVEFERVDSESGEFVGARLVEACPAHKGCTALDVHNDNRRANMLRAALEHAGLDNAPERVRMEIQPDRTFTVRDRRGSKAGAVRSLIERNFQWFGARLIED